MDPFLIDHPTFKLPGGARAFRCAFQVNPFSYLGRQAKVTTFTDEDTYNKALVDALVAEGVHVIAVTDHHRVDTATSLAEEARARGIVVFPGFEAKTSEGVHILCLFDPAKTHSEIAPMLGRLGVDTPGPNDCGRHGVSDLLDLAKGAGAVCIAAHATNSGGLLKVLSGQARANAWKHSELLACAIPGASADLPIEHKSIVEGRYPEYSRAHPVALVNARDVSDPADVVLAGSSCWLAMSSPTLEGLRQSLLDPESRVRLVSDDSPIQSDHIMALSWTGGFLDEAAVRLNTGLNVLIGGRGAGKSTVIESIRFVLGMDVIGEAARKTHDSLLKRALGDGAKIVAHVCSCTPYPAVYRIERQYKGEPIVYDHQDNVLDLSPRVVFPNVEVFGQHEISELARDATKQTTLLNRFVEDLDGLRRRKDEARAKLNVNRDRLLAAQKTAESIVDQLAQLPFLEETARRYQAAGIEQRLQEQTLIVKEEKVLSTAKERLAPARSAVDALSAASAFDRSFLSAEALSALPGRSLLTPADGVLADFAARLDVLVVEARIALTNAENQLDGVEAAWGERKASVQAGYDQILRELKREGTDGSDFIEVQRLLTELAPLKEQLASKRAVLSELEEERKALLRTWHEAKNEEFLAVQRAAKRAGRELSGRVRVSVHKERSREPLVALMREHIGGRIGEACQAIERREEFSLIEFVSDLRAGRLAQTYTMPQKQAEILQGATEPVLMEMEALDLPTETVIELNVSGEGQPVQWQPLDRLSAGQKATAVLLLLLLHAKGPLIVDQPEDDLDNRFIVDGIVPRIRKEKRRRQLLFSTHNANIPVLGDAELIIGLRPDGEAGSGRAEIPRETLGAIDEPGVGEMVKETLEGGFAAFQTRRRKYGF